MRTYRIAAENSSKDRAVAATAYQVAHDIRSPLAALDVVAQHISEVPEDIRTLLKPSVERIKEIADVLIEQNRSKTVSSESQDRPCAALCMPVATLIDEIVAEKKATFGPGEGRIIEHMTGPEGQSLFVDRCIPELRRTLANLLTNALEALAPGGKVGIEISAVQNQVEIAIRDNGCGIPEAIIPKLFARKATFGKESGNGLGLYFAKQTAEQLGGTISLESQLGKGTAVSMRFPSTKEPAWFAKRIALARGTCVVTVDDDHPIHQLWNVRFKQLHQQGAIQLKSFRDPENFAQWWAQLSQDQQRTTFLLCDHEMQAGRLSGVDLIQKLNLEQQSVLVTSHCGDRALQHVCVDQKVRMLPKSMASTVPLQLLAEASPAMRSGSEKGHPEQSAFT